MADQFSRTEMLIGPEGMAALGRAHVAVFGVGGVVKDLVATSR